MAAKEQKQHYFLWEGTDRAGKRVKGEMRGLTVALVKADLRRQGVAPMKVRKKPTSLFTQRKKKITPKEITVFSRQLATMVSSGIPLVQAFEIVGKGHDNPSMQDLVLAIKTDLEGGSSLSQAMRKHPRQFDDLFCNLVKAGEQAGILENLLHKIAIYKEKVETLKSKIKKAMYYPVAVLAVAIIITIVMMVKVVPEFENMFTGLGAELPLPTQIVIAMSNFVQASWLFIVGGIGIGLYAAKEAKHRSKGFNLFLDKTLLRLPVLGAIIRKATIARYARTLGTMFAAGVPLVEALESVAGATGNRVYELAIMKIREDVATGQQLQMAMTQTKLFPNMTTQMVSIGEETGSLDSMLSKIADFYEEEVDEAVDGLSSLMEPVIIVVIGGLIGGLVVAMYMPIFQMGQVI